MTATLETRDLFMHFGGLAVTNNVNLSIERGARQALIGANGAGKTTLVNLLTGALTPTGGRVILDGVDITGEPRIAASRAAWCAPFRSISSSPACRRSKRRRSRSPNGRAPPRAGGGASPVTAR